MFISFLNRLARRRHANLYKKCVKNKRTSNYGNAGSVTNMIRIEGEDLRYLCTYRDLFKSYLSNNFIFQAHKHYAIKRPNLDSAFSSLLRKC